MSGLSPVVAASDVVITCGSGGVGKTTTAAAIGVGVVRSTTKRVLVITIDPAKRLADALGLAAIGNVETRVDVPEATGELWIAMLDMSASWDDLIRRHAPDAATVERILANPLYRNITQRFVQSHDYIAMERLHDVRAAGRFDLIVIDTPPSRHAFDFLDAPARMADFFGSPLLRWITLPYRTLGERAGRLGYLAAKPFYQVADRILGSQFLQDVAEFFLLFQGMYDGFVRRAEAVTALLHDERTSFVVVSTPESAPLHEADYFLRELSSRGLRVGALVLNRVLPDCFVDPDARAEARAVAQRRSNADPDDPATVFLGYAALVDRQRAEIRRLTSVPDTTVLVPVLGRDIADIEAIALVADALWDGSTGTGNAARDQARTRRSPATPRRTGKAGQR